MAASMASMAGRHTIVRTLCRASTNSAPRKLSLAASLRNSNSTPLRTPIVHPSPLRLLRRELSSFKPVHSAIASAYLVSKLPCDAITSSEDNLLAMKHKKECLIGTLLLTTSGELNPWLEIEPYDM